PPHERSVTTDELSVTVDSSSGRGIPSKSVFKKGWRNDTETLERRVASHPGRAGGVGPGQHGGSEAGSDAAVRDDHGRRHVRAPLADCLPPRWADAGDGEGRADLARLPNGRKDRAARRHARGLLAGPERHAGGLRL